MNWISAISGLFAGLIGREAWEWLPRLTRFLLRTVTLVLPLPLRELRRREWEAELEHFGQRRFSALLWVLCLFPICVWQSATSRQGQQALGHALRDGVFSLLAYLFVAAPFLLAFTVLTADLGLPEPVRWTLVFFSPVAMPLVGSLIFMGLIVAITLPYRLGAAALARIRR